MVQMLELAEHSVDLGMQYRHLDVDVGEPAIAIFLTDTTKDTDGEQSIIMEVLGSTVKDVQTAHWLDRANSAFIEL